METEDNIKDTPQTGKSTNIMRESRQFHSMMKMNLQKRSSNLFNLLIDRPHILYLFTKTK